MKLADYLMRHSYELQKTKAPTPAGITMVPDEENDSYEIHISFFKWAIEPLKEIFPAEWGQVNNISGTIAIQQPLIFMVIMFLGLPSADVFFHLFIPFGQNTEEFAGEVLRDDATGRQVSTNIEEFLKNYKPEYK
jgi:hypothetical protein